MCPVDTYCGSSPSARSVRSVLRRDRSPKRIAVPFSEEGVHLIGQYVRQFLLGFGDRHNVAPTRGHPEKLATT